MNDMAAAGQVAPEGVNSILILGAAKSGTTALFYAIRSALTGGLGLKVEGNFEPVDADDILQYLRTSADDVKLVKALLGPILRRGSLLSEQFDRRIVIYRDPRDNIVSRIVFILTRLFPLSEREKIAEAKELLRQKEQSPGTISIVSIVKELARLSGRTELLEEMRSNATLPALMKRRHGDQYFMMPYDDLVNENFSSLSTYLGFQVTGRFETDERHAFVARTKTSGEWRNWFLDEDVAYFASAVADDFRLLGFDPDERPNDVRVIPPASCTGYIEAQFARAAERRRQQKLMRRERDRMAQKAQP